MLNNIDQICLSFNIIVNIKEPMIANTSYYVLYVCKNQIKDLKLTIITMFLYVCENQIRPENPTYLFTCMMI